MDATDSLDALFTVTCGKCRQTATLSAWLSTPLGWLPTGFYRCPHCRANFQRRPRANRKEWEPYVEFVEVVGEQL